MARKIFLFAFLVFLSLPSLLAQLGPTIARVSIARTINEKTPVAVSVELTQMFPVQRMLLFFRRFGESEFQNIEMMGTGRQFDATIPAENVTAPFIEYYISITMTDRVETYPIVDPEANPLKLLVQQRDPKDSEVRILSPEPGETVSEEEFNLVISFFYASDAIDPRATRIFLDGVDVTKEGPILADDLILFAPRDPRFIQQGARTVRIEVYDTLGRLYHTVQSSFTLLSAEVIEARAQQFLSQVDGQAEARHEKIDSLGTTYLRADIRNRNTWKWLDFGFQLHLDNQEDPSRQPQNRYSFFAGTSFLRLQAGDAYPIFPTLIASGKRVRGFSGNLVTGYFNLDVAFGETERSIEGIVDSIVTDTSSSFDSRPPNSYVLSDSTYALFRAGTYKRQFVVVRPSFGKGDNFQLGFTYMKSKDDLNSIHYGIAPAENLVAGSDLLLSFDDDRVRWESQIALSVQNTDITTPFTQADFDSLKIQDPKAGKELEDLAKIAERFITINANVFPTNPISEGLPGIAYESAFSLNYFNNFFRILFFRRGAAYKSFGNEFLQSDIGGFAVTNRTRLFSNRAFLSLSYERKADNTANTKDATTTFDNMSGSLSLNLGAGIPALTFGYGMNLRESDKSIFRMRPDSTFPIESTLTADDNTNRFFFSTGYDFTLGARHSTNLTVTTSALEDATFYKREQSNTNLQLSVNTMYDAQLQSFVSFMYAANENTFMNFATITADSVGRDSVLSTTTLKYSSLSVGAQYRIMDDKVRLTASLTPFFGDFKRITIQIGADYYITDRHTLEYRTDLIQSNSRPMDFIASLIYRFNF